VTDALAPNLPALPDKALLAQLGRETAAAEQVQPFEIEKDFFLTRLLWALGQAAGGKLLLKVRVPAHADHRFRSMPITDSGASRSPIPADADHRFRSSRSPG